MTALSSLSRLQRDAVISYACQHDSITVRALYQITQTEYDQAVVEGLALMEEYLDAMVYE